MADAASGTAAAGAPCCASTRAAGGATLAAPTGARHPPRATPATGGGDAAPPPGGLGSRGVRSPPHPPLTTRRFLNASSSPPAPSRPSATAHGAAPPQGAVPPRPASTAGAIGGATDARAAERARGVTRPQRADGRGSEDGGAAAAGVYEWRTGCLLSSPVLPPNVLCFSRPLSSPRFFYLATFWTVHIGTCLCLFLPAGTCGYTGVYPPSTQSVRVHGHDRLRA